MWNEMGLRLNPPAVSDANLLDEMIWSSFPTFQADVLVSATSPVGEDQPHTEHVGACGEKGLRIHLTPSFLAGKKLKEYGPQGMDSAKAFQQIP